MIIHHMAGAGTEVTTLGKCRPLVYAFSERLRHVRWRPSMSFWCLRMVANKTDGQRRRSEVTSAGTICQARNSGVARKSLHQPVTGWVIWSCSSFMRDTQKAQFLHHIFRKFPSMVRMNNGQHLEPTDNPLEKRISKG